MRKQWTFTPSDGGSGRNMAAWEVSTGTQATYLVEASWPLTWRETNVSAVANVIFAVDGNAMFLTATDVTRRQESLNPNKPGTIVIGLGYPLKGSVYSPQRSLDLTPPCDHYTPPEGPDGSPRPEPYGGADRFLSFINHIVRPFMASSVFPNVRFARSALFGHSYGGLFVLNTLLTQPTCFDTYIAASPSIWWNGRYILTKVPPFLQRPKTGTGPILRLSYGTREQFPVRRRNEPLEKYERRVLSAAKRRMADNCNDLYLQLVASQHLGTVERREYLDEDHGSVISPALSGGILYFLELEDKAS
ncbi:siderophore esterase IroE-like protein [Aspergillus bombycis]|uniref:Siderophore esterase IroE-like protein n=1 Tax=Aspergillus bombycis TaxID=109264 RepID=A0A1F7ZX90_9EURO|nr:siderophore esterase IroE-like protein [Aspergillus bombycis]OGM44101.1 siderophore esterase IroE-like protein [Aspergillus bombycis]